MRNNFYNKFKKFVEEKVLFGPKDRILLAVSGGVDSVVMAHLFHRAEFNFAIAHCNFQLRGKESEADEAFVKELAKRLSAPVFVQKFDTKLYAVKNGISIQMAARDIRYAWFEELLQAHNYNYIGTAHHKDDVAETILLNLIKGSVLKGLHGILPKSNHIIRPLSFASKDEITSYALFKKHGHREDKSNAESKYQRNLIRNEVMPLLKHVNPEISDTIYRAAQRRHEIEEWANRYSEDIKSKIITAMSSGIRVSVSDLKTHKVPSQIFFEWIESYGFNYAQVEDIFNLFDKTETRLFLAKEYRMVKDRGTITIERIVLNNSDNTIIEKGQLSAICGNFNFDITTIHKSNIENFDNQSIAYLDEEKLQFPLLIRKWEHGDSFKPYGLRGHKKISDFLTDLKLNFQEKENQLVICSGNDICWVVGRRIDERFKIGERTSMVLKIEVSLAISD